LHITNEDAELETRLLNMAIMHNVDGVILITCQPKNTELFNRLNQSGLKIVFMQRQPDYEERHYVGLDTREMTRSAVSQLIDAGYSDIGILLSPIQYTMEEQTFDGYVEAHRDHDMTVQQHLCAVSSYDREGLLKEAVRLVASSKPPQVIVVICSQAMDAVLKACEILNVPRNSKPLVVAYMPSSWSLMARDGVIFIQHPYADLAELAYDMMLEYIQNDQYYHSQTVFLKVKAERLKELERTPDITILKEKKKLRVLLTIDRARYAMETLKSDFEKKTGYKLEIEAKSYPKMYGAVKAESCKDNFDVLDVDIPWIAELAQKKSIENLDDYIAEDPTYYDDMLPNIFKKYSVRQGSVYAIPFTFCTQMLFYRKDCFADIRLQRMFYEQYKRELRPPRTWEDFNTIAQFFTRKYNADSPTEFGTTLGSRMSSGGVCEYLPRLWSFGGEIHNGVSFTLDSAGAVAALENYVESFRYASKGSCDNWWGEQAAEFRSGKAAMTPLFTDNMSTVTEWSKSKINGKIGFDFMPNKVSVDGGWALAVNACSRQKKAAFEFIKWATNREISVLNTIMGGFVPCKTSMENLEVANIYPWLHKTVEASEFGRMRELPIKANGVCISEQMFEDILGRAVYDTVTGQAEALSALKIANNELNELLKV
ncbi:MAG: extracellular solute-binding protein, partial [Christensenella sp.]